MNDTPIANLFRHGNISRGASFGGPQTLNKYSDQCERAVVATPEQVAEMRAREVESARYHIATALVATAEALMVTNGWEPSQAFDFATQFWTTSQNFIKNFKLPENIEKEL